MQAVLLCAGKSSRFFPFTARHKSLFTVCGRPVLSYTLEALVICGIRDLVVVVGPLESGKEELIEYLNDGKTFGFETVHYVDEPEQAGMGRAVQVAAPYIHDSFLVINPYHITIGSLLPLLTKQSNKYAGVVAMATTDHPERYGMLDVDAQNLVRHVVEKPLPVDAPSNKRLLGAYVLKETFLPYLDQFKPAPDHFEKALSAYAQENSVLALPYEQQMFTLKYPWHMFPILHYLLDTKEHHINSSAKIASTAIIEGKVVIDEGAVIYDYAVIKGPVYIGKNAKIGTHSLIREYTCIEEGASIGCFTEIRNSRIGQRTSIHSGFIGDSIIGNDLKIGAGFCTANRRLDRGPIKVSIKNERIDSEVTRLGVLAGDGSSIGINVSTMPGAVISPQSIINAGSMVM